MCSTESIGSPLRVRGQVPRKQGLKPRLDVGGHRSGPWVRGQVPRKQGLKRVGFAAVTSLSRVRGQVPRKQGLKLQVIRGLGIAGESPRASSKKTRIETMSEG